MLKNRVVENEVRRNTDQEEHPLLVSLPGELLEATLSDKLSAGLNQIVIANLKIWTNLNNNRVQQYHSGKLLFNLFK